MLLLVIKKLSSEELEKVSQDLSGYIKFVVDIEKKIMTAGGLRHVEGEELLLKKGSKQQDLWGGGLDIETNEIDFDSMINLRPSQGNPSREVLDEKIRHQIEKIVRSMLQ
jgi:hypothetical protein